MPNNNGSKSLPQCDRADGDCPHGTAIIELRADMKIVKNALVGDLESRHPGLVDVVRDHGRRLEEIEQTDKSRRGVLKAVIGTLATTWIGIAATVAWVKLAGKVD